MHSTTRLEQTASSRALDLLNKEVDAQRIPGYVLRVELHGNVVLAASNGLSSVHPQGEPVTEHTQFDIASMSKPIATAASILQLTDAGLLGLDTPLAEFFACFSRQPLASITVRHLLTHTSGLAGWRPLYAMGMAPDLGPARFSVCSEIIASEGLYSEPGVLVAYSCLGFILLGLIVELVSGHKLDEYAEEHIFKPLGMYTTYYRPQDRPAMTDNVAATEQGNAFDRALVARGGRTFTGWREQVIRGQVHDGNAWYALGGVSGNAGLFSTAQDLCAYLRFLLSQGTDALSILSRPARQLMITNLTQHTGMARGLGWALSSPYSINAAPGTPTSNAKYFPAEYQVPTEPQDGSYFSANAFGHTGFTGTSVWADPQRNLTVVLLTNAVHVPGGLDAIRSLRPRIHNIINAGVY